MKWFFSALWGLFRNNLLLKIMALLFAVILWSYVLTATNPPRERTVSDVTVRYENTEELRAKGLAISGSLSDALDEVDIKVEVKQNEVRYLSDENVEAYIDLSTINGTGECTLKVSAQTTYGEVLSVTPSKVKLVIEDYVTKTVPVNVEVTGSVPSGYHASDPVVSASVVSISGARGDVEKVASSVCEISLDGLTEGYNKSIDVTLLDDNGEVVDKELFGEDLPSVIVDLSVLPMKSVPVDAESAILGTDSLASGYEITSITCDPERVNIVGEQSVLDGISSISLVAYSVSSADKDINVLLDYAPVEGVEVLETTQAQVYITIREISDVVSYKDVDIVVKNVPHGLTAQLETKAIDVVVMAGLTKLSQLERSDVVPYIDLEGYEAGTYTLSIQYELPDGFVAENFSSGIDTVTVTLSR